ncbi:YCF48-related protein [Aromatoleum toluclasticum]|uniref:YCF48-related protein n=1 Tax=Aromatoleum toluclasticum TaxID=92003 RepID=UPI001D18471D|nr:YCF48-related protein [Aromatoleum toluclasticum]MCC4115969.1 YCF48-related protein [Aromatoleum toluclasticum]
MEILSNWRRAVPLGCLVASLLGAGAWATTAGGPFADEAGERAARASARIEAALFLAVARAGERLVAVGERGFVQLSDDGGRRWRQAREVPVSVTLTNVQFVSASVGWAVGHGGVVLHTRDGGERWERQLDGTQAAALILEDAQAAAAGSDEPALQRAVREAEGLVADGADKPLLGLHFQDERRGWVVGAYGLALATEDGGQHWRSFVRQIDNRGGKHLYDVRAQGGGLVVAGEQGALFRAEEAGQAGGGHFAALASPYAGTWFGAVTGPGEALLVFGLRGNAYRREAPGAGWVRVESGLPVTLTAGARLDDGSIVLADESGRLLRSTDGGGRFAVLPVNEARSLTGIVQAADGGLVLSGARGMSRLEPEILAKETRQ